MSAVKRGNRLVSVPGNSHRARRSSGHEGLGHISRTRALAVRFTKGHSSSRLIRPSVPSSSVVSSTNAVTRQVRANVTLLGFDAHPALGVRVRATITRRGSVLANLAHPHA